MLLTNSTNLISSSGSRRRRNRISVIDKYSNDYKKSLGSVSFNPDFFGKRVVADAQPRRAFTEPSSSSSSINAQVKLIWCRIRKVDKWWKKGVQPNMKEIIAQDLVDLLTNSGDKLIVVDFFSPSCGGCKALHPKCLADMPIGRDESKCTFSTS